MSKFNYEQFFKSNKRARRILDTWLSDRIEGRSTKPMSQIYRELSAKFGWTNPSNGPFNRWLRKSDEYSQKYALAVSNRPHTTQPGRKIIERDFSRSSADVRRLSRCKDFAVTSAVANCRADPKFVKSLQIWCEDRGGQLLVNPVRYKNPQSKREADWNRREEWWDPMLEPHMIQDEIRPHSKLSIMATKVQATANNPLPARLSGRTQDRSAVFGHPQLAMKTVATPHAKLPKILYSSGACTEKDYSDTLAGDMAEFHHTHSAVLVEVRGSKFHLREVTWDGEAFLDAETAWSAEGWYQAPREEALVMGDIHVDRVAQNVMRATFGPLGMVGATSPRRLVLHDLPDLGSCSPHDAGKRLSRALKERLGRTDVGAELDRVAEWLDSLSTHIPSDCEVHVVRSNHDMFLDRWLEAGEKGVEPRNLALYHRLCAEMLEEAERTGADRLPDALPLALHIRGKLERDVDFLRINDSLRVLGVEMGLHGHLGANGARGGPSSLSRIGTRVICGHTHQPAIWQGAYFAGLSAEYDHDYNAGPSGWLQSHVALLANGYRQMRHVIGDHWRG